MDPVVSPISDAGRLAALWQTRLLDSPVQPSLARLTRLASLILQAPVSLVSLVDEHRQFFASAVGLGEPWASKRETPLSHSFCKIVVETQAPLVVQDARNDPRVCDNLAIRDLGVASYLGVPLTTNGGWTLGSLCVIDSVPRQWTAEQLSALQELCTLAMAEIDLRREVFLLQSAQADAHCTHRVQSGFLAQFSHELRTPLNAIIGYGMMLADETRQAGQTDWHEQLKIIVSSGEHLLQLIADVLDMSKAMAGKMEISHEPVAVPRLCRELAATVLPLITRRHNRLILDCPLSIGVIHTDPLRLRQILLNLLSNAAKFTDAGTISLVVTREQATQPLDSLASAGAGAFCPDDQPVAERCVFRVRDTGIGMSAGELARLFEPFTQVGHRKEGGTGLGLVIARQFARLMGGDLTVASEPRAGSVFTLTLPITSPATPSK